MAAIDSNGRTIWIADAHRDTTGNLNTANGYYALYYNTTGRENTATGPTIPFKGRVLPGILRQEWGRQV